MWHLSEIVEISIFFSNFKHKNADYDKTDPCARLQSTVPSSEVSDNDKTQSIAPQNMFYLTTQELSTKLILITASFKYMLYLFSAQL